ncbi:MAG: SMC family ATPase [Pyrinomonadaceae bacterium]
MLITKVELEDVKSHHNSVYEFQPGTTAITGANGAGKTTIIEAIAWALFDFLEYNRDDFARRGTKKGTVRVTFQSGLNDKFYTVIRETTGKHRVFDEEAKTTIAEQNANVMNFMRQHLQVEPGTNLKELYRAAIGVPQGTFTAVFLDNATTRKTVFDRLLKVEEYREGAKKLGDTVNLIKDKQKEVEIKLAVAKNDLANFEPTENEYQEALTEIAELERVLDIFRSEIENRLKSVAEFDSSKTRLGAAQQNLRDVQAAHTSAAREQAVAQTNRDTARAATEKLKIVEPDYRRYLAAESSLKGLESERETRDKLRESFRVAENNLTNAKAENLSLEKDLRRALQAGLEADALVQNVVEQENLENEYKNLLVLSADSNAARKRVDELEPAIIAKRSEYKELSEKIRDGEKGAEAETNIVQLDARKKQFEIDLQATDKALASLTILQPQLFNKRHEIEELQSSLQKTDIEIAALEQFSQQAARVGELAEIETSLAEKIANLRAAIEWDAKFQREVKNGVCPILPERCLNLREGEVLAGYLTDKSTANTLSLKNFEKERQQLSNELKTARDAEKNVGKLNTLREQAANVRRQIVERETARQNLQNEITALANFTPQKQNELRAGKAKIEGEIRDLHEAARNYAALEGFRRQIQNLKEEGSKLGEEQKRQKEIADKLTAIETQIKANQNRSQQLDNPKARAENFRREAMRRGELQKNINENSKQIEKLEAEKLIFETQLAKFAALDEKLSNIRALLEQTQTARDEFMQNKSIAEKLPDWEREVEKLTVEVQRLKSDAANAESEHEAAKQSYNAEKHIEEKTALDAARTNEASTNATLTAKKTRENQLNATLTRLTKVREAMHDDLQAQEKLRSAWETTDYIRETLKKAAPHVGEILRYEIAKEATKMFREVTGEVGRSLKWTEDYEILLDENGYQRPFANFSGGEQMAAALSIRLSLLTQLSDVRIAFFDEPTTNLDRERRERLAQQIGQIRNFNQLFVISHDDTFESDVDHQISVAGNLE